MQQAIRLQTVVQNRARLIDENAAVPNKPSRRFSR